MDVVTLGAALSIMKKMPDTAASSAAAAEDAADRAEAAQAAAEAAAEQAEGAIEVDDTLSVEGRAADAKAVGDKIVGINVDLTQLQNAFLSVTWTNGYYTNFLGKLSSNANSKYSSFIPIANESVVFILHFEMQVFNNMKVCYYDKNFDFISYENITTSGAFVSVSGDTSIVPNAAYLRLSAKINTTPAIYLKKCQLKNLEDFPVTLLNGEHDTNTNYVRFSTCTENTRVDEDGTIKSQSGYYSTDYIELRENVTYYRKDISYTYYAFYDEDHVFISSYSTLGNLETSFTIPTGAKYGRFSMQSSAVNKKTTYIFTQNDAPEDWRYIVYGLQVEGNSELNPCDYKGKEITVFNKCLCVGDSLTYGTFNYIEGGVNKFITDTKYSYPTYLHKMTGIDVTNLGHGGNTSDQWYDQEKNNDLSGYDLAIIQLGMNDALYYVTFGSTTQTAISNIITKLKNENTNIKIFIANIIPTTTVSYSTPEVKQFSADMLSWLETNYSADANVIPVDIQQYGHTGDSQAYNCGHLSALGYERLAKDYIGFISHYIDNHKMEFQQIQFIGTDKVWS